MRQDNYVKHLEPKDSDYGVKQLIFPNAEGISKQGLVGGGRAGDPDTGAGWGQISQALVAGRGLGGVLRAGRRRAVPRKMGVQDREEGLRLFAQTLLTHDLPHQHANAGPEVLIPISLPGFFLFWWGQGVRIRERLER